MTTVVPIVEEPRSLLIDQNSILQNLPHPSPSSTTDRTTTTRQNDNHGSSSSNNNNNNTIITPDVTLTPPPPPPSKQVPDQMDDQGPKQRQQQSAAAADGEDTVQGLTLLVTTATSTAAFQEEDGSNSTAACDEISLRVCRPSSPTTTTTTATATTSTDANDNTTTTDTTTTTIMTERMTTQTDTCQQQQPSTTTTTTDDHRSQQSSYSSRHGSYPNSLQVGGKDKNQQQRQQQQQYRQQNSLSSSSSFTPIRTRKRSRHNMTTTDPTTTTTTTTTIPIVRPISALQMLLRRQKPLQQQNQRQLCVGNNPTFTLPHSGIVEIAGPAGVGKTQLAITMCADCVSSSSKGIVIYVALGPSGKRSSSTMAYRLNQMLQSRYQHLNNNNHKMLRGLRGEDIIHECMSRVYIRWVRNSDELMELLQTNIPRFLRQQKQRHKQHRRSTRVIILDGIANLFRLQDDIASVSSLSTSSLSSSSSIALNPWHNRAVIFFQISRLCKQISDVYHVPFVIVNEATSTIRPSNTTKTTTKNNQEYRTVLEPALGLAWSQCVDCRFFVERKERRSIPHRKHNMTKMNGRRDTNERDREESTTTSTTDQQYKDVVVRLVRCIKAPHISTSIDGGLEFYVDDRGAIPIKKITYNDF